MNNNGFEKMYEYVKEMRITMSKLDKEFGGELDKYPDFRILKKVDNFGDLLDSIFSLENALNGRTDGRPAPIDKSVGQEYLENYLPEEEYKNEIYRLKLWAECSDPGYSDIALIGGVEFDREELIQLRDWITDTLKFHDLNTAKRVKPEQEAQKYTAQTQTNSQMIAFQ